MTYKPAGRGGMGYRRVRWGGTVGRSRGEDAHARWRRAEQERKEDSGRRPRSWMLESLFAVRGWRWGRKREREEEEKEGCNL